MKQKVTILGSTGSIGVATLDVIARHKDRYEVVALTAHSQVEKLALQCRTFSPKYAVVMTDVAAKELQSLLIQYGVSTEVCVGNQALCEVVVLGDIVMAAIVGAAGLPPTLAAAQAGKKILLANKEALVMSGKLFMDAVVKHGATLLPIDSEHNAIFQCLPHGEGALGKKGVSQIILTASGGPFLRHTLRALRAVTPDDALAHPNWVMGKKISVDCATMLNKGLEVIEAHWLFGAAAKQIDVVIHRQSVIHSMVSYVDGSVLAQMAHPDMRVPIAYGLAYPERIDSGVAPLNMKNMVDLTFETPDLVRFPCLSLAWEALQAGGTAPALLNAANEVAVSAFLSRQINFLMIPNVIEHVLNKIAHSVVTDLASLLEQDGYARRVANDFICSKGQVLVH